MTQTGFYLAELCRLYVFVVFLVSSVSKAATFTAFEATIGELFRVPVSLARNVAYAIIGVEAVIALLMVSSADGRYAGMIAAMLLLIVFTAVIVIALFQQKEISCHCFGSSKKEISGFDLIRNAFMISACGFFLVYPPLSIALPVTTLVLLFGVAIILFVFSTNFGEIALIIR